MIKIIFFILMVINSSCSISSNVNHNENPMLKPLIEQFEKISIFTSQEDKTNEEVSKWSRYKQLEHILLANNQICDLIEKGEEPKEKKSRSFMSYVVFTFGFIPRGAAEAPQNVAPSGITQEEIVKSLEAYKEKLAKIKNLGSLGSKSVVGNHPYFGSLTRLEWLRFIEIHTNHHLKIIRDI